MLVCNYLTVVVPHRPVCGMALSRERIRAAHFVSVDVIPPLKRFDGEVRDLCQGS